MLAAIWAGFWIFTAFVAAPIMFAGTLFVGAVVSLAAWQEARRTQRADKDKDYLNENPAYAGSKPAQMGGFAAEAGGEPMPSVRRRRWRRSENSEWIAFTVSVLMTLTGMSLIAGFIWFVGFRE